MTFSCEKSALLPAVLNVCRAVPSRSSLTALEGILIEAGERLSLTGFNLEIGITETVEATIPQEGNVIVNARLLADIVRRLPDDTVYFSLLDKMILHIECGKTVFDISSCLDGNTYPKMPSVTAEQTAALPQKMLREMIRGTLFAVSDNDAKVVHKGSKFVWEEGTLSVVSVDGYRLALRKKPFEGTAPSEDFVVPGNALHEVERLLDQEEEEVQLVLGGRHILFQMGAVTLITRLLDGEFLSYQSTIPKEQPVLLTLDVEVLIAGLERVSLLINEKVKNPVRLKVEGNFLHLSCATALGAARDDCPVQAEGLPDGQTLEIGFNHRYLLDALYALPEKDCVLKLSNPLSPCVITPREGDEYLYMILPVRLRADA